MLLLSSTLQYLVTVYKRDIIKTLGRLNGWVEASLPDLMYEEPKMQDILEITEALRNMATAGMVLDPNDPIGDEIRSLAGLKPRPDDAIPVDPDLTVGGGGADDLFGGKPTKTKPKPKTKE